MAKKNKDKDNVKALCFGLGVGLGVGLVVLTAVNPPVGAAVTGVVFKAAKAAVVGGAILV